MSIIFSFAGTHQGNLLKPFVTVLAKVKALGKKREDFETNEGEWTGKVEIRTTKTFLAVDKAPRLYSDLQQALKGENLSALDYQQRGP